LKRLLLSRKLTSLAQRNQQDAREDKLDFSIGGILVEQRPLEMNCRGDSQAYSRERSNLHDIDWRPGAEKILCPLER
jgi:hypothetical protein